MRFNSEILVPFLRRQRRAYHIENLGSADCMVNTARDEELVSKMTITQIGHQLHRIVNFQRISSNFGDVRMKSGPAVNPGPSAFGFPALLRMFSPGGWARFPRILCIRDTAPPAACPEAPRKAGVLSGCQVSEAGSAAAPRPAASRELRRRHPEPEDRPHHGLQSDDVGETQMESDLGAEPAAGGHRGGCVQRRDQTDSSRRLKAAVTNFRGIFLPICTESNRGGNKKFRESKETLVCSSDLPTNCRSQSWRGGRRSRDRLSCVCKQ